MTINASRASARSGAVAASISDPAGRRGSTAIPAPRPLLADALWSGAVARSLRALFPFTLAACALAAAPASAIELIGYNQPAPPLSAERIAQLPAGQRDAWHAYLRRSAAQMKADRAALAAERRPGVTPPPPAKPAGAAAGMPLDKPAAWYAGAQARAIADTIVSFQTPAGGWSKNQDRTGPKRLPGQSFSGDAAIAQSDTANFDKPADAGWTYVGTLDNGATTTEIAFLGLVAQAVPGRAGDVYRASVIRGARYMLAAQYPNGGWPQVWPLQGGYHDGITFNDNAMTDVMATLDALARAPHYGFLPAALRREAAAAVARGVDLILAAQVRRGDRLTGWPQQADPLTLAPISARNYEMPSIASAETSDMLMFLMQQPRQSVAVRSAIDAGIAWLKQTAIYDRVWTGKDTPEGRRILPQKGAGPLWSRNYDVKTDKPIFGDRDKSIHDDIMGVGIGRRNGYAWYVTQPTRAIAAYAAWSQRPGAKSPNTGR